jgi:hypothetical protein
VISTPRSWFVWGLRRRIRKTNAKLDVLSRRMGLLQMGHAAELFATVPGLADLADGGLGSRKALQAIETAIESGAPLAENRILDTIEELDQFIADGHRILNEYDRGRRRGDRLFAPRKQVRGLFP